MYVHARASRSQLMKERLRLSTMLLMKRARAPSNFAAPPGVR